MVESPPPPNGRERLTRADGEGGKGEGEPSLLLGCRVDPNTHGVEWEEGSREASGVEENPGRGCHGVGGGIQLSPYNSNRHEEGGTVTSGTADGGGRRAAMGHRKNTVGKREAAGVGNVQIPGE